MDYHFHKVKIKNIKEETATVKTFILSKQKNYTFRPGQFCWLSLEEEGELNLPMAIASGQLEKELRITMKNWGENTQKFFNLKKGNQIFLSDAMGTYIPFNNFVGTPFYLIAGGTGIAPIRSVLNSIKNKKLKSKTQLFYGVKTPDDFIYEADFEHWQIHTIVEEGDDEGNEVGFVTKLLSSDLDTINGICFVCGPYQMLQNVISLLQELGFTKDQIYVSIEKIVDGHVIGPVFPVSDLNVTL